MKFSTVFAFSFLPCESLAFTCIQQGIPYQFVAAAARLSIIFLAQRFTRPADSHIRILRDAAQSGHAIRLALPWAAFCAMMAAGVTSPGLVRRGCEI
jgi:hypothetical protein